MIPSIGGPEILILLAIVLLLFGAKRIPELARGLGSGVKEFREGISGKDGDRGEGDSKEDEELPAAAVAKGEVRGEAAGDAPHAESVKRAERGL